MGVEPVFIAVIPPVCKLRMLCYVGAVVQSQVMAAQQRAILCADLLRAGCRSYQISTGQHACSASLFAVSGCR